MSTEGVAEPRSGAGGPSRRAIIGGAAVAAGAVSLAEAQEMDDFSEETLQRRQERYVGFGEKASGGPGDNACGAWLEDELRRIGYEVRRQPFEVPAFEAQSTTIEIEGAKAAVIPQAVVVPTGPGGVSGPLKLAEDGALEGAIALVVLPHGRWSGLRGAVASRVTAAVEKGAAAVVIVTTGPSGRGLGLNAPVERSLFDRPVAILAPREAGPFVAAARVGQRATLRIAGRVFRRPAYNLIGALKRGAGRTVVLSTPRSGWFACAGERAPGVAVWLALCGWAARLLPDVDIEALCTSGHEYDNAGGAHYLEGGAAPAPDKTALWVHLGANVAARDWHELGPELAPLPGVDSQRYLMASPGLLASARAAFKGQPGLEQVYEGTAQNSAGELTNILRAGYPQAIGVFGGHRLHHAREDDLRCLMTPHARLAAQAFAQVLRDHLA